MLPIKKHDTLWYSDMTVGHTTKTYARQGRHCRKKVMLKPKFLTGYPDSSSNASQVQLILGVFCKLN